MTSELPAGWRVRPPALTDVTAILEVVHASDIAAIGYPDFTADDVREVLTEPKLDIARDTWLALTPDGQVAGWSYLEHPVDGGREFVEVYVHPRRGLPARRPLLALALRRVAECAARQGQVEVTARAGALPGEQSWIATLREAGFEFVKRYARMKRSLDGVSPLPPAEPDGVTIRPLRSEDEADLRSFHAILDSAFRDTPDYDPVDFDTYRRRLAARPSMPWDECFVAEVDGAPVGILQSSDQSVENDEGWVKNLAVLREHRKRGIGAALLARAFAAYAAKGRRFAGLGVDLTNPTRAYRLYAAVGMTAAYEADMFEKTVTAAQLS